MPIKVSKSYALNLHHLPEERLVDYDLIYDLVKSLIVIILEPRLLSGGG